jgi:hypothetical protein
VVVQAQMTAIAISLGALVLFDTFAASWTPKRRPFWFKAVLLGLCLLALVTIGRK